MKVQIKTQFILTAMILVLLMISVIFFSDMVYSFDTSILEIIYQLRHPVFTDFFTFITNFFSPLPFIGLLTIMSLITLYHTKQWKLTVWFLLSHFVGLIIFNSGLKHLIQRSRPAMEFRLVQETTYSFPSGHSASVVLFTMLCTYLFITYFPFKKYRASVSNSALIIILFIGFSRMYLGVHYLTDVIAGYCVGLITAMLAIYLLHYISNKHNKNKIKEKHGY